MTEYARILDGEVAEFRDHGAQPGEIAPNKGRWVPVEAGSEPSFDAATQRLAPSVTVEADRVLRGWSVEAIPIEEQKAAKLSAAQTQYETRRDAGFPLPGGTDSLQARSSDDQANWLTLKDACNEAVAAGQGDQPCALPIRTTANATLSCTYSEAATTLRNMRDWGASLMARLWALKDAIDAASDAAALAAIDVTTGWPD